MADNRNLKRGWGLCCSKKCAAKKREKSRPNYDETDYDETYNNSGWADDDQWGDCDLGIHD